MEQLQVREREIFETLKSLKGFDFVVIGGYAVNSYTLPRFSVDCDIVIKDIKELNKIEKVLFKMGYSKKESGKITTSYLGEFDRYEKEIENGWKVSIDVLIGSILDRQTNTTFSAEWVFKNSSLNVLNGKTISQKLKLKIIHVDALFVMKFISARNTDIRDIFMIGVEIDNLVWVKEEILNRIDFKKRLNFIQGKIIAKQFRDGLQGVFGIVDERLFEKHKKVFEDMGLH